MIGRAPFQIWDVNKKFFPPGSGNRRFLGSERPLPAPKPTGKGEEGVATIFPLVGFGGEGPFGPLQSKISGCGGKVVLLISGDILFSNVSGQARGHKKRARRSVRLNGAKRSEPNISEFIWFHLSSFGVGCPRLASYILVALLWSHSSVADTDFPRGAVFELPEP